MRAKGVVSSIRGPVTTKKQRDSIGYYPEMLRNPEFIITIRYGGMTHIRNRCSSLSQAKRLVKFMRQTNPKPVITIWKFHSKIKGGVYEGR